MSRAALLSVLRTNRDRPASSTRHAQDPSGSYSMSSHSRDAKEASASNVSVPMSLPTSKLDKTTQPDPPLIADKQIQPLENGTSDQKRPSTHGIPGIKDIPDKTSDGDDRSTNKQPGNAIQLESQFSRLALSTQQDSSVLPVIINHALASQNTGRTSWRYTAQFQTRSSHNMVGRIPNEHPSTYSQEADLGIPTMARPIDLPLRRSARLAERNHNLVNPTSNVLPRPHPTPSYLRQACREAAKSELPRPLLIIVDLNGCLLDRGKNKGGTGRHRPYLHEFLQYSLDHHRVMVWSSATPANVQNMSHHLFQDQAQQPVAVWNRSNLRLTPAQARQKIQIYKQLHWVWDDNEIAKSHPHASSGGCWDQSNTILIDDSVEKAAAQPYNQLLIPCYDKSNDKQEQEMKILHKVIEYLKEAAHYEDISSFIFNTSFPKWLQSESLAKEASGADIVVNVNQV